MEPWLIDYIRLQLQVLKEKVPKLDPSNAWQLRTLIKMYEQVLSGKRDCKFVAVLKRKKGSSMQEKVLADSFFDLVHKLNERDIGLDDISEINTNITNYGVLSGAYKFFIPKELYAPFFI